MKNISTSAPKYLQVPSHHFFPYYISIILSSVCEHSHTRYNVILTVTLQVGGNDIHTHLQIGNQGSK